MLSPEADTLPLQDIAELYQSVQSWDKEQYKSVIKGLLQKIQQLASELSQITEISQKLLDQNKHLKQKYALLQEKTKLLLGADNFNQNFTIDNSCNTTKLDLANTNNILQGISNNLKNYEHLQNDWSYNYGQSNLLNAPDNVSDKSQVQFSAMPYPLDTPNKSPGTAPIFCQNKHASNSK